MSASPPTNPAAASKLEVRLLYLEDQRPEEERTLEALARRGIEPHADIVHDLQAFETRLGAGEYEVILAAGTDALAALGLLRKLRKLLPFILISGDPDEEAAVDALRKGATDLVDRDRLARLAPAVCRALEEKMLRDARTQAEAALRSANQVLTALIRCAPLPIGVIDRAGTVNVWNPAAEEVLGWKKEEVLSRRLNDVLGPDEALTAALLRSPDQGGLRGAELRQRRRDGATLDLRVFSAPLRDEDNRRQGIIGMFTDVTEMNLILEAYRESRERFQSAFLYAPNGMALTDLEGRFLRVNPAFSRMFGYGEAELRSMTWTDLVHPDDRAAPHAPEEAAAQREIRMLCRSGCVLHVLWSMSAVRDAAAAPLYNISQLIDFTRIRKADEKARQYAADLERSNSDLQHFAYVASHDLQEPLRMIRGFLELLAKRYRGQLDESADEYIGYAVDGAVRMQNLIRGLLAYSRVGTQGKSFAPVKLEDTLAQALLNLQLSLAESGAEVSHGELPVVRGDDTQLAQLFQNLVGNAIKFRSENPPQITIAAADKRDVWEIAVADNGIGFNPEHANRIFQMFQRLHGPTRYPGTGIGLALCKRIVERHGGCIWVKSEPAKGSTFCFTLPKEAAPNG
ncbi:MAG: PAS domain S-box protein [Bryobacteraceae bacterium]|nr:PAS domain S-box protein [Bryobacteraceae bacterium]